jgi:hypothetical protein
MRSLTKLAIASVVVAATCGVIYPIHGDHRDIAVRTNSKIERQLISQGDGQNDQNLKLLLAQKIFAGAGSVSYRKVHTDPVGRAFGNDGKPSS